MVQQVATVVQQPRGRHRPLPSPPQQCCWSFPRQSLGRRNRIERTFLSAVLLFLLGTWQQIMSHTHERALSVFQDHRVGASWEYPTTIPPEVISLERILYPDADINSKNIQSSNVRHSHSSSTTLSSKLPPWLLDDKEDEWEDEECMPFSEWQITQDKHKPWTCNLFHEMDVTASEALQFIACGGARCAYEVNTTNILEDDEKRLVLKWTKGSKYSAKTFDKAMKDTLAMERLQHSPYILKIYGNCGSSQLLEAATHGTLKDQIILAKMADHKEPDGLLNDASNNLRVAYHLVKALADVHHGVDDNDDDDSVTFTHNDIDCEQYIFIDGVFKLNDFHYASHELRNRSTGLGCKQEGVKWSTPHTKLRAPEEFIPIKRGSLIHRNQVDVWMLGDVLYYVLTNLWVMEGRTNEQVFKLYSKGTHSKIPKRFLESRHPAHRAMIKAVQMAWTFKPDDRPSAKEIADFIEQELVAVNGGSSDAPWRVEARPIPPDFDFGDDNPRGASSEFIGYTDNYRRYPDD